MKNSTRTLLIVLPLAAVLIVVLIIFTVKTAKKVENKLDDLGEKIERKMEREMEEEFEYGDSEDIDRGKPVYGNRNVIEKQRKIKDFDELVLKGAYEVYLKKSDSVGLVVKTDENLQEYIVAESQGNTLEITTIKDIKKAEEIKLILYYSTLKEIDVRGAARIMNKEFIESEDLEISVKGAASLKLNIKAAKLEVEMAGGSHANLGGECKNADIFIGGVGVLSAYDLKTQDMKVHVAGAGSAKVWAEKTLDASISGAGSIKYKGNPEVTEQIAGFGKIHKVN